MSTQQALVEQGDNQATPKGKPPPEYLFEDQSQRGQSSMEEKGQ